MREMSLEQQLQLSAEMGLKIIELGIANYETDSLKEDSTDTEIASVLDACLQYGIVPVALATGNDFTSKEPSDCWRDVEKVKQTILVAEKIGATFLRIFAGFTPVNEVVGERWRTMIDCLNEVAEFATAHHVVLAVETHGGVTSVSRGVLHHNSVTTTLDTISRMLKEVDASVMLNYDPANLWAAGMTNPSEVYQPFIERIGYVHVKNFKDVGGALQPVACGEGSMDFAGVINDLRSYSGSVFIEYEIPSDVERGMKESLRLLRKENIGIG
jgi:sugar phosphate isomerase/epimerase